MSKIDERITIIANASIDKNGFDLKILDIKGLTTVTDYFIIVSGNSTIQTTSIADEIEEKMLEAGYNIFGKEGYESARWILLDFGDVIAHIFHREDREFYNLEKLWADGEEMKLDSMI